MEKSPVLYSTIDHRWVSKSTSTFLAFAVLAFFVCMYLGAEAMLGWLPADWGRVDKDGEFQPFVGTLAVLFMLLPAASW
jgi:hypothetical protein